MAKFANFAYKANFFSSALMAIDDYSHYLFVFEIEFKLEILNNRNVFIWLWNCNKFVNAKQQAGEQLGLNKGNYELTH